MAEIHTLEHGLSNGVVHGLTLTEKLVLGQAFGGWINLILCRRPFRHPKRHQQFLMMFRYRIWLFAIGNPLDIFWVRSYLERYLSGVDVSEPPFSFSG